MGRPSSLHERAARFLVHHHERLRPVLPRGYHAYPARGGRIYLDVRESAAMLARALWAYEVPKSRGLASAVRPGATVLDIGGNKGDFSLLAAKASGDRGRVLCFEPEPENAEWIRRSVAKSGYRSVEVVEVALSDGDGEATLHLSGFSGWHSLTPEAASTSVGAITVPTRRLDSVLAERGVQTVDVVKIDVEGAEARVLEGAGQALRGSNPVTMFLDLHPPRVDPAQLADTLRSWGFEIRRPAHPDLPLTVTAKTSELVAVRANPGGAKGEDGQRIELNDEHRHT
jgi:FkbM family methyltransferase